MRKIPRFVLPTRHSRLAVIALLLAGEAIAVGPPAWTERTPAPDARFVYVVGTGVAKTKSEAEKAALRDALEKLGQQIAVTISARTISVLSTEDQEVVADTRQSVRGRIKGAEPIDSRIEIKKSGMFFFRRKTFHSKILVRYPKAAMARERERQTSAAAEFKSAIERLARATARALRKVKLKRVAVGDWREISSGRRYTLSRIVEQDLSDALNKRGIGVVARDRAKLMATGSYRIHAGQLILTARLRRMDTGREVVIGDTVIDEDAVEPSWLSFSAPIDPHFEALEPERADIRSRIGAISIDSKPQSARVFVDGDDRGKSPVDLRGVAVGNRSVTVLLDGYEPFLATVKVVEGRTTPLEAVLKPRTGDLEVKSRPSGAEVFLKGRSRGETPTTIKGLLVGSYNLTLRLEDHEKAEIVVAIKHKETTRLNVDLVEKPGSIFIISEPPGAMVMIDGVEVGKASSFLKVERVKAGTRKIEALLPGVGSWTGSVRVRAHEVAQVTAKIEDRRGSLLLSLKPPEARVAIKDLMIEWVPPSKSEPGVGPGNIDEVQLIRDMQKRMLGDQDPEPRTLSVPLIEGKHEIRVVAEGYEAMDKTVRIRAGRVKRLDIDLKPKIRSAKSSEFTDTLLAAGVWLIPGSPFLLWNDRESNAGTYMMIATMLLEAAALADGNYAAAGAIHGGAIVFAIGGEVLSDSASRNRGTGAPGFQVAWSTKF